MATLIKLLAMRIVAKSFFGFSKSWIILRLLILLDSERSFLLATDSEKKATSDPEIIPDKKTRIVIKIRLNPKSNVSGLKMLRKLYSKRNKILSKSIKLV